MPPLCCGVESSIGSCSVEYLSVVVESMIRVMSLKFAVFLIFNFFFILLTLFHHQTQSFDFLTLILKFLC